MVRFQLPQSQELSTFVPKGELHSCGHDACKWEDSFVASLQTQINQKNLFRKNRAMFDRVASAGAGAGGAGSRRRGTDSHIIARAASIRY